MRILLHACCAPCLVVPLDDLRQGGHDVTVYFFNPNIHPYSEYLRRLDALTTYSQDQGIRLVHESEHDAMEDWFRQVVFREQHRCVVCFHHRMTRTAMTAETKGFEAFSTTLLYSRFQKHDLLKSTSESISEKVGIPFFYRDWRSGWTEGVKRYRKLALYRQKYCGCLYSEKERAQKII